MPSELTIDATKALADLERAAAGSVANFYRLTRAHLDDIAEEARRSWPRDTGRSADSIAVFAGRERGIIYTALSISPAGKLGLPAYKVTWSRYSKADRDKLLAEAGASEAARASSPRAADAIRAHFRRRVQRRIERFGVVPPLGLEKKRPWRELVLKPAKAGTGALVNALQGDLTRLARGG